jgi:rubredoxin
MYQCTLTNYIYWNSEGSKEKGMNKERENTVLPNAAFWDVAFQ